MTTSKHLRHVNFGLAELNSVEADRDELKTRLSVLEAERRRFEEHYELLAYEKVSTVERVASLDGSVKCLSHRFEFLVDEKKVLEGRVEEKHRKLEAEELRTKAKEEDVMWLLQKGVFWVVDRGGQEH